MKGPTVVMTLVLLVAGVTAVPLSGVAQTEAAIDASVGVLQSQAGADNESVETSPGARLSAIVGAQEAEVRGEIDSRSFDAALERASSAETRARVIDRRVEEIDRRLDGLDERKRDLQRAHRDGNITTGTYVAELTTLAARIEATRELANQSHAAARGLPSDVAERQGINVTAIGQLERRAATMTGPEVARIARSIAGPDVGRPVAAGPPDHAGPRNNVTGGPPDAAGVGPPDDSGNAANSSERGAIGPNASDGAGNVSADPGDVVNGTIDAADERASVTDAANGTTVEPKSLQ